MSNSTHDTNASAAQPAAVPLRGHEAGVASIASSSPFDNVCSQMAAGHLLIAKNLIDAGQLPEAIAAIDLALASSPRFAASHFWKGVVLFLLARHEEAHEALQLAADFDPTAANTWLALAHVEFEQQLPESALKSVDRSVALNPKNPRAHMLRAAIMLSLGERGDAIVSDEQAVLLAPGLGQARLRLAHSLLQAGDEAEAIDHIFTALKMQSADVNTRLCLANLLLSLGQLQAAIDECLATAQLFPLSPHPLVRLAQIHVGRQEYPEAISAVERALQRVPKHLECQMTLADIYLKQGEPDLAIDKDLFEAQEIIAEAERRTRH